MPVKATDPVKHARYVIWASKVVRLSNRDWQGRRPYRGESLMTADGLHHWLFRWAIDAGLIEDPGPLRQQGYGAFVAVIFDRHPELVRQEARNYWRQLVEDQET